MLAVVFHPLAEAELDEAVGYLETIEPGKGLELARDIQMAITRLQTFPDLAPINCGSVRSWVVQPSTRWRYILHYRVGPASLRVLAIAHQKRQPFYWFGRR